MAEPTYIIKRIGGEYLQFTTTIAGMRLTWHRDPAKASTMDLTSADTFRRIYSAMAKTWEWQVEQFPVVCTEGSARWCPVCGDCTCRPKCPDCGDRLNRIGKGGDWICYWCNPDQMFSDAAIERPHDDPKCALHRDDSQHAQQG